MLNNRDSLAPILIYTDYKEQSKVALQRQTSAYFQLHLSYRKSETVPKCKERCGCVHDDPIVGKRRSHLAKSHVAHILLQRILKEGILESKVRLNPLGPPLLEVEVHVSALLILVRGDLRLLVSLEPSRVLRMEPPALLLQLLRRQVLLVRALGVVENEEQTVDAGLFVEGRIVEGSRRRCRIRRGGRVRILRLVRALPLRLVGPRHVEERVLQTTKVPSSRIGATANGGTTGLTRSNGRSRGTTGACTTT